MHANKGNRKPNTSGASGTKSQPHTPAHCSRQRLDHGKSSVKRSSRISKDSGSHRASMHVKRVLSGKIGRRAINGFVSKSVRSTNQLRLGHRPKRNAIHRTWDYTAGLSWKEEKELKKALMASLQESKKPSKPDMISDEVNNQQERKKSGRKPKLHKLQIPQPGVSGTGNQSQSSHNSNKNFPVQVRAQRKFAQGSRPCSPGCSPAKGKNLQSKVLVTKKAKTEDFLTFLCLRGSTSLPPHLDFSNNFMENDTLSSFPSTPRTSQDGSRPSTPMLNNGNHGSNKGMGDRSRSGSPDVEITLDSHELGVKPLVGASVHNMVSGGVGRSTSTRACASLTNRCIAANRCTTNALSSLSDSNSSFCTTNPPSSTSTPSPVECSPGGSNVMGLSRARYTSISVNTGVNLEPCSRKRYATRGKQKTVQEIIADKEHRSSLSSRRPLKTGIRIKDVLPLKRKQVQKSSILSRIVPRKNVGTKGRDKNSNAKSSIQAHRQNIRLAKLEGCPYTFSEEPELSATEQSDQERRFVAGDEPMKDNFLEGLEEELSTSPENMTPVLMLDDVMDDTTEAEEEEATVEVEDEMQVEHNEDLSSPALGTTCLKMEIATQTSDTSSYTAEIDPSCLVDENLETDTSDEEDSSQDRDETDFDTSPTETESEKEPESSSNSHSLIRYSAGSLQAVSTLGQQVVSYPVSAMGTSTAVSQPIVTITNCPMTTAPSLLHPVGLGYGGPISTSSNLAHSGVIAYNGNTFPIQTCTVMGQNLILDDGARPVILNDATNQVINSMSVQMQGFSVQHGLSALPLDAMPSLPYVQSTLGMNAEPPQTLMPNTLATIDNSNSPMTVVHNAGIPLHRNKSFQVTVSTVAMGAHSSVALGTQCGSVWPQVKKSIQNLSSSFPRSLPSILPKILPAPTTVPSQCPVKPCTTSALSVLSSTAHLRHTITCSAAVNVLNVHTSTSPTIQPPVCVTMSSTIPSAPARPVPARCMLAAQTQSLAYTLCPLPPTVMAPGLYQACRPTPWPCSSGNSSPTESHASGLRNFVFRQKFPLETPENSPVKNGSTLDYTMQMEADTTVLDDNLSGDQSTDVIILGSTSDSNKDSDDQPPRKRLSMSRTKPSNSKSPDRMPVKRKVFKSSASRSPIRSPSPAKKVLKKPKEKKPDRSLRSTSRNHEEDNTIDLTAAEDQSTSSKVKTKHSRKPNKKDSFSPTISEQDIADSPSARRKLRTISESKDSKDVKDSIAGKKRTSPSKKRPLGSPGQPIEIGSSRRDHLRSARRSSPMSLMRTDNNPRPSNCNELEPQGRASRSKTGPMPKAAIPAGFPLPDHPAQLTEVPTYHPSAEQFQDPIAYLNSIWQDAESYGMCRIVPPDGWKPECDINEELRFTTQVQYIHKMADRWGPAVKQLECIKHHLKTQLITIDQSPCIGGVELDLPAVSAAIQSQGGLQSVINKTKWPKVMENIRTPKTGQERISRLYEIYCKYLLSYDTLCDEEREHLEQEVDNKYQKGSRSLDSSCSSKGRSKPLSEFFRVARNTQSMWFNEDEPTTEQVEDLYWQLVEKRDQHVSIQVAHIDTKHCGSAFPAKKDSPYARHGWNYNVLQHHSSSVLRHLGQVTGLTVPMLHIGMAFSTSCWARDPHFLPYIVYSHTGADVIWYCIPSSEEAKLKQALEKLAPKLIDAQSPIWLPEDSVMVDPNKLLKHNVSHCRTVQHQGEFVVVFPKAFTATVTCGYNISESLHFAAASWLPLGAEAAQQLYAGGEPDLFSMEKLLVLLATEEKTPTDTLQILLPLLEKIIEEELDLRKRLGEAGLQQAKKVARNDPFLTSQERPRRSVDLTSYEENRCDSSCKICYFSTVVNEVDNVMFALQDALQHIRRKKNLRNCKLLYRFDQKELKELVQQVKNRISAGRTPSRKKSSKNR